MTESANTLFERLMRRHQRQAYHVAYRLTGNHADAEDLAQEAFVRAFRFFDTYRRDLPFEKWLFRIISNLFVDDIRRRSRIKTKSLDETMMIDGEAAPAMEIADSTLSPERLIFHEELDDKIHFALNQLPVEFRQTVILADIEGKSYEEISEALDCNIGTVRSRLHRGRKLMRKHLEGFSL
ncbi:MAG: sigma-70 family RNA polymerase sigma factor [Armatimonadaceae bacterium]|jgi:RNA polymerase sigma-70 factor (ECF subfamily)